MGVVLHCLEFPSAAFIKRHSLAVGYFSLYTYNDVKCEVMSAPSVDPLHKLIRLHNAICIHFNFKPHNMLAYTFQDLSAKDRSKHFNKIN